MQGLAPSRRPIYRLAWTLLGILCPRCDLGRSGTPCREHGELQKDKEAQNFPLGSVQRPLCRTTPVLDWSPFLTVTSRVFSHCTFQLFFRNLLPQFLITLLGTTQPRFACNHPSPSPAYLTAPWVARRFRSRPSWMSVTVRYSNHTLTLTLVLTPCLTPPSPSSAFLGLLACPRSTLPPPTISPSAVKARRLLASFGLCLASFLLQSQASLCFYK